MPITIVIGSGLGIVIVMSISSTGEFVRFGLAVLLCSITS